MDTFCRDSVSIWRFIGEVIYAFRIVIPIIIVILGTIDLGKAVMAGEEKTVKEAQKAFIKRLIYGVAIFFVTPIVQVIFGLLDVDLEEEDTKICWDCAATPNTEECLKYFDEEEKEEIKEEIKEETEKEELDDL